MKYVNNKEKPQSASNDHINRFKMAHMIGVAEYMRENANNYGLNADQMYVLGLLHDIGYLHGRAGHELAGANILANAELKHDFIFAVENHAKDPYELELIYPETRTNKALFLLYEADMSIDSKGYRVGFDKRLQDIGNRYGYDHIAYERANTIIRYLNENRSRLEEIDNCEQEKESEDFFER